ncbi:hypothetical protein SeLEV6574_g05052 [Synchytrium endobioticum]|uniref:BRCA1-associated protein n=1 Tax=Synchytrium endobioticum TaxID=286115 RepID=A0A507CWB4_9FUNG|nr:hypothetical protein SeLEV6574_g05052 [Synchytrium endobioticum]
MHIAEREKVSHYHHRHSFDSSKGIAVANRSHTQTALMYLYSIVIELFTLSDSSTAPTRSSSSANTTGSAHIPSDIFGELKASYKTPSGIKHKTGSRKIRPSISNKAEDLRSRDYRLGNLSIEWVDLENTPDMSADEPISYSEAASWTRVSRPACQSSPSQPIAQSSQGIPSTSYSTPNKHQQQQKEVSSSSSSGTASSLLSELVAAQRDASLSGNNSSPSIKTRKRTNAPIVPTSGIFVPFKSGKSKLNAGIVHLYRDRQEIQDVAATGSIPVDSTDIKGSGTVLCVLAVPSYMSAQDFLAFVGPARKTIAHLRIVRDSLPNRYMVLAKFRDAKSAERFKSTFDGKQYNTLETEVAHIVYVKSVEFKSRSIPPYAFPPVPEFTSPSINDGDHNHQGSTGTSITSTTNSGTAPPGQSPGATTVNPLTPTNNPTSLTSVTPTTSKLNEASLNRSNNSSKHIPSALVELPTCPVCLERMDASATGLLTIICHHTFHCSCLAKWGDSSCPVCRYSQQPKGPGLLPSAEEEQNECAQCSATGDLWICLLCGNIGCGRYRRAHAREHFQSSQHLYALELETQRVWDYAGDGYVHRLIQNRADGKLVELPPPTGSSRHGSLANDLSRMDATQLGDRQNNDSNSIPGDGNDKSIDAVGVEYGYLLATQLESQRIWYEVQLNDISTESEARIDELMASLSAERLARESAEVERDRIKNEDLPTLAVERKAFDKKLEKLMNRVGLLERALAEEKQLNIGLQENQVQWKLQIATRDKLLEERDQQVEMLQEQLRDVMFYLETQQKVEQSGIKDEIASGQLVITNGTPSSGSRKKGKSAKR